MEVKCLCALSVKDLKVEKLLLAMMNIATIITNENKLLRGILWADVKVAFIMIIVDILILVIVD